jgi:predicted  nucleic acid-binding Zn-ribbon protein
MRECLTLEEVDKKVSKLDKTVTKINKDIEDQHEKMKAATAQASQAQALLAVNKS